MTSCACSTSPDVREWAYVEKGMHSHPAHLTVVLTDWQGRASTPDGPARNRSRKAGDVFWSEAETHKVENTGKTNSRVLIIELKAPAQA
jgi:hypothetical protein